MIISDTMSNITDIMEKIVKGDFSEAVKILDDTVKNRLKMEA